MSSESESPDLQKAKTFFQYGNDAAMKSNLDYAIAMYRQACKLVPDNMVYRQSLRGVERKKFNNDPKKVGMLVGVKNQPLLMQAKSARSKGKFHEALEHCEDAFVNNPWDVGAARVAAEAAEGLGLGALSQWLLDSVQEVAQEQGRRFLPVRRRHLRGQRELGQGHRLLGAGQEDQPERPGRQPQDQRAVGGLDDQAGGPRRRPGSAGRAGQAGRRGTPPSRWRPSSIGSSRSSSRPSSG